MTQAGLAPASPSARRPTVRPPPVPPVPLRAPVPGQSPKDRPRFRGAQYGILFSGAGHPGIAAGLLGRPARLHWGLSRQAIRYGIKPPYALTGHTRSVTLFLQGSRSPGALFPAAIS